MASIFRRIGIRFGHNWSATCLLDKLDLIANLIGLTDSNGHVAVVAERLHIRQLYETLSSSFRLAFIVSSRLRDLTPSALAGADIRVAFR